MAFLRKISQNLCSVRAPNYFILSLALLIQVPGAMAKSAPTIECQYTIMGAPFFHVSVELSEYGKIGTQAKVDLHGAAKTVDLILEAPQTDELYRIILAPNNPGDTLYLVLKSKIVETPSTQSDSGRWNSILINPGIPIGKEAPGECIWP